MTRALPPIVRRPGFVVAATVLVSILLHAPFLVTAHFGEADAARIAITVIEPQGAGPVGAYGFSSPLYVWVLRLLVGAGLVPVVGIFKSMAVISLVAAAVTSAAFEVFVWRLTGRLSAAITATAFLQLVPPFWSAALYGFSTVVALALLFVSLCLFQHGFASVGPGRRAALWAAAALLYLMAVATKVDMILASAIYCLPVWQTKWALRTKFIGVAGLFMTSCAAFLLFKRVSSLVSGGDSGRFLTGWTAKWQWDPGELINPDSLGVVVRSIGVATPLLVVAALVLLGRNRTHRSAAFWVSAAALPALVFWSGISATGRHFLTPSMFTCLLFVLPLGLQTRRYWWTALAVAAVVNYLYFPPDANPNHPSGRVVANSLAFKAHIDNWTVTEDTVWAVESPKVAVIGALEWTPYFVYDLLTNPEFSRRERFEYTYQGLERPAFTVARDNRVQTFLFVYTLKDMQEVAYLVERGFSLTFVQRDYMEAVSKALSQTRRSESEAPTRDAGGPIPGRDGSGGPPESPRPAEPQSSGR